MGQAGEAFLLGKGDTPQLLELGLANRHGLIAGATGTGKTKTLQLLAGVDAHAADRAGRLNESEPFVLAQRLGMHAEHPGRDANEVEIPFECHA